MNDFAQSQCIFCGRPSSSSDTRALSCVNEVAEAAARPDGKTATVWRVNAREEWCISICSICASSKYGGQLTKDLGKAWKYFVLCFVSLLAAYGFWRVVESGSKLFDMIPGSGLVFIVALWVGVFGTPPWFIKLVKTTRKRAKFLGSGMIPEKELSDLYTKEGQGILDRLQGRPPDANAPFSSYRLPNSSSTHAMNRRRILAS
jgi:hypothetical protein